MRTSTRSWERERECEWPLKPLKRLGKTKRTFETIAKERLLISSRRLHFFSTTVAFDSRRRRRGRSSFQWRAMQMERHGYWTTRRSLAPSNASRNPQEFETLFHHPFTISNLPFWTPNSVAPSYCWQVIYRFLSPCIRLISRLAKIDIRYWTQKWSLLVENNA